MDEKLVDGVAAAFDVHLDLNGHTRAGIRSAVRAAFAVINASGTHWIAPWKATENMQEYGADADTNATLDIRDGRRDLSGEEVAEEVFAAMRDAYLAEAEKREYAMLRRRLIAEECANLRSKLIAAEKRIEDLVDEITALKLDLDNAYDGLNKEANARCEAEDRTAELEAALNDNRREG